jgi:hypothetical protein
MVRAEGDGAVYKASETLGRNMLNKDGSDKQVPLGYASPRTSCIHAAFMGKYWGDHLRGTEEQ